MTEIRDDVLRGIKRIADYTGFSEDAAQRLCSDRKIPAFKIGARWFMRRSRYLRMIEDKEAS
jgi:hypothetical protein